jgi:NADH:ubiquinone oxidoreductase subunit 6 (subunit J)
MLGELTFVILAGTAILSSLVMISREKAAYSAMYFVLTLLAVSGIFLQLHAPLLFVAQWIAIACLLFSLILFAVEVAKLDVALADEYYWRSKAAAVTVTALLLVEIALMLAQRHFLPGENVAIFLPQSPVGAAPSAGNVMKFFLAYSQLPLVLLLFIVLIAVVGVRATFQRRA